MLHATGSVSPIDASHLLQSMLAMCMYTSQFNSSIATIRCWYMLSKRETGLGKSYQPVQMAAVLCSVTVCAYGGQTI